MKSKKPSKEEIEKQINRIEFLARRLPWMAVIASLLIFFATLLQIYLWE